MTIIQGSNFILRKPKIKDAGYLKDLYVDKKISEEFGDLKTIKEAKEDIREMLTDAKSETLFIVKREKVIGQIWASNINSHHKSAVLMYFISSKESGKDIMTKAIHLFLDFIIKKHGLVRIQAWVFPTNIGSKKVLEKNGFLKEGVLRKEYKKNGKFFDRELYAYVV